MRKVHVRQVRPTHVDFGRWCPPYWQQCIVLRKESATHTFQSDMRCANGRAHGRNKAWLAARHSIWHIFISIHFQKHFVPASHFTIVFIHLVILVAHIPQSHSSSFFFFFSISRALFRCKVFALNWMHKNGRHLCLSCLCSRRFFSLHFSICDVRHSLMVYSNFFMLPPCSCCFAICFNICTFTMHIVLVHRGAAAHPPLVSSTLQNPATHFLPFNRNRTLEICILFPFTICIIILRCPLRSTLGPGRIFDYSVLDVYSCVQIHLLIPFLIIFLIKEVLFCRPSPAFWQQTQSKRFKNWKKHRPKWLHLSSGTTKSTGNTICDRNENEIEKCKH